MATILIWVCFGGFFVVGGGGVVWMRRVGGNTGMERILDFTRTVAMFCCSFSLYKTRAFNHI